MAGEGGERLYWMHFEAEKDGAHVIPAPVLVESVASIQRVVYLLAKFTRGEELGRRASFSRALREAFALQCRVPEPGSHAMPFEIGSAAHSPLVAGEAGDVRRLFRRVTAAVGRGDVDEVRALVPDPRHLDCLGDAYRKATPPSHSGVSYWLEDHRRQRILDSRKTEAPLDDLGGAYRAEGEFGISVSASSRSHLHHELQEALSMLWIEYGDESPDRLSPKARRLRTDLRKRLAAA